MPNEQKTWRVVIFFFQIIRFLRDALTKGEPLYARTRTQRRSTDQIETCAEEHTIERRPKRKDTNERENAVDNTLPY